MTFTDEQLSAYLDGALPESEMDAITDALADSDELADRLANMRGADTWLRQEFAAVDKTPVRQETLDMIDQHGSAEQESADTVVAFRNPKQTEAPRGWPAWGQAVAASVTLAVGVLTGMQMGDGTQPAGETLQVAGLIAPSDPLHIVLQSTPSMQSTTFDGGITAMPTLSFAAADGTYCRELTITAASTENRSLACQTEGGWLVRASVAMPKTSANEGFTTASADTQLIDETIRNLMQGDTLTPEQEIALIDKDWN